MPLKDKEARLAYQRARYARIKAEDPEYHEREAEKKRAYARKREKEDEAFRLQKRADHKKWLEQHGGGTQYMRDKYGHVPFEQFAEQQAEKRRAKADYMKEWAKTEAGRRSAVAMAIKKRCGLSIDEYD